MEQTNGQSRHCLYPGCESTERGGRGLCAKHYVAARYLVKKGSVTWESLEKAGKCIPVSVKRGVNVWFMEGVK